MSAVLSPVESDFMDGSNVAQLRVPPNSVQSESSVLGALLLDNNAFHRMGDSPLIADDFYRYDHRLIFAAISALITANKPADVVTVFVELEKSGKGEEVGGLAYLNSLATYIPSASNIRRYAEIVREQSILRKLVAASDAIAVSAFNPQGQTVDALLDGAEQQILNIGLARKGVSDGDFIPIYEGMLAHSAILERRHHGELTAWPTGLADLDEYLEGGFRPGELVIVGARPSMGKTALGMTIGVNMAQHRTVAVLSMEMSHGEVNDRLTAMLGNVSMTAVKRPARGEGLAWDRVMEGVDKAKGLRLHISDQGALTIHQVRTKARNLKRKHGLDVLVVDYIGLMTGLDQKANRNTQLGEVSRGLKALAKELQICVLCLAQLNRNAEEKPDQMPQMSNLRDSGEIEQDADVILFIKRPIMANPELNDEWKYYAKLSVAKNRQGRCGYLHLTYLGEQTRFGSWSGQPPMNRAVVKGGSKGME
jgi:replicative DNA helicase